MAWYVVLPGSLRLVLGSPASRHSVISVVRCRALHLWSPATYWLSHLILNLKLRYGSKRWVLTVNRATCSPPCHHIPCLRHLSDLLTDLHDYKLGRLEWRKTYQDVNDAQVDVALSGGFAVAFDKECLGWGGALKCPLAEQVQHERVDIQTQRRPQIFVVRLKHRPLDAPVNTHPQEDSYAPHGDIVPLRV